MQSPSSKCQFCGEGYVCEHGKCNVCQECKRCARAAAVPQAATDGEFCAKHSQLSPFAEVVECNDCSFIVGEQPAEMKNPPNFVMYVVMVKPPNAKAFDPRWSEWAESQNGRYARGFASKSDADKECREYRVRYGKKNAYIQQYGPIS